MARPRPREVLVIRGKLDRAGRFTMLRSRSTPLVRQWPVVDDPALDVTVELLDRTGRVLHREQADVKADVDCRPGAPQSFRVIAHIELRPDAAFVRLMHDCDLQIWREAVPEAASLEVGFTRTRGSRDRPMELRFRYSPPGDAAHLTIVYQWGTGRFRPIYIGPPRPAISVNLRDLPGGEVCRFAVTYSNGLRSAHAATEPFRMPLLGPAVEIVRPGRQEAITARTPVILQGMVSDPERPGGAKGDEVRWFVDELEVATGLLASVDGLSAGRHRVTMSYGERPRVEAGVTVQVEEAAVPTANEWEEWDPIEGNN